MLKFSLAPIFVALDSLVPDYLLFCFMCHSPTARADYELRATPSDEILFNYPVATGAWFAMITFHDILTRRTSQIIGKLCCSALLTCLHVLKAIREG